MLTFDLSGDIERLRKVDAWQRRRNSKTLVKHPGFRILLRYCNPRGNSTNTWLPAGSPFKLLLATFECMWRGRPLTCQQDI